MSFSCTESIPPPNAGAQKVLIVVIGNTTTSLAVFENESFPDLEKLPTMSFSDVDAMRSGLNKVLERHPEIREAAVCSVVPAVAGLCAGLLGTMLPGTVLTIGTSLNLPFTLRYDSPETFGADRIALCAYSQYRFPDHALIAVDIGTAITFDVLNSRKEYLGGMILPGLDMMAGALHDRTAQLPLIRIDRSRSLLGQSTADCIKNGIFWGTVMQVRGLLEQIELFLRTDCREEHISIIATGGNSPLIANEIGNLIVDDLAVVKGSRLLLKLNRA